MPFAGTWLLQVNLCVIQNHENDAEEGIHTNDTVRQVSGTAFIHMREMRIRYGKDYEQPTAVHFLNDGYNLPAGEVIHIVGPVVSGNLTPGLKQDLARCNANPLDMCLENGLRSIAFCRISTGVFRFPQKRAAQIAVKTVREWLQSHEGAVDRVIFNVFTDQDKGIYEQIFR